MKYRVGTIREAGLEARWGRTRRGTPLIFARKPGNQTWFVVDGPMWDQAKEVGIKQAFEERTLLGDIFSIPA